jgi:hypothetical protein
MVFIMPVFLKQFKWLYLLLLLSHSVFSADFTIIKAKTHLLDDVYLLDATFNYKLSAVTIDALQNGVVLTLVLNIVIERERSYLWDKTIANLEQIYELKYSALSKQYILKYKNTGIQETFPSLNEIITRINHLNEFPLLDKYLIEKNETYMVSLQIELDIESLPIPLRPIAYLSSQWRLSSDWYLCPLKP